MDAVLPSCSKRLSVFVVLAMLLTLSVSAPTDLHAQSSPSLSITLSPAHSVPKNTAITATITLNNLDPASYSSLIFRGDLTDFDPHYPTAAASCEDEDMGQDLTIEVDESRETFTVGVYKACSHHIYAHYTLDASISRADMSATSGKVELASASTQFMMSRYLGAGETITSGPTSGASAWISPDPATLDIYVGEWVRFRPRTNVLLYLNHHVGVDVDGSESGHFISAGEFYPGSIDVEQACRDTGQSVINWRRAIHQGLHIAACKPGDAVILIRHETDGVAPLYRREFRILARDENVSPSQVTGVSVTEEVEQLSVSWNQVVEAGGYKVQWKSGGQDYNEESRQHLVSSGATTKHTITNLSAGIEYTVRVIATGDNTGDGLASAEVTGTPLSPPPPSSTIANAPENLRALAGNSQATLSWDAPGNDGGAAITSYQYRLKESGGDLSIYMTIPESGPGEANEQTYTVTGLTNERGYVFHVRAVNRHGGGVPEEVTVMLPSVVHTESEELPTEVALMGNYPNPFSSETTIEYALPASGRVRLSVYDMQGREVATLVDGMQHSGKHASVFDAMSLSGGTYLYRLEVSGQVRTGLMTLMR